MFKKKNKSGYLTLKGSRKIIKYNVKQMKYYEGLKKKKIDSSVYTTTMKDPNNIIEIENLQTYFFTDRYSVCSLFCR